MTSRPLAFFIPFSFGRGVERVNVTLARVLAECGLDIDVVAGSSAGPYFSELKGKARIIDLSVGNTLAGLPALMRYMKSERPSAMLSAPDSGSIVALWARELARVDTRLITVTHAVLSKSLQRKSMPYRVMFPRLLRWIYPRADANVAVSKYVADDLASMSRLPAGRIEVIPNPVVHKEMLGQAQEPITHPWLEKRDGPVILSVGRLNEEKNYEDLIRAFARLRRTCPARLIILGDGAEKANLAALARELGVADEVDLHGFVDNPYAYMARADLLALSSHYEALPTVLIEAMACGCPVVATDSPGGVREILEHGRYGRLVPVGDDEAFAQAMLETLNSATDPEPLKQRAMDYHVDRIADRYRHVLDT